MKKFAFICTLVLAVGMLWSVSCNDIDVEYYDSGIDVDSTTMDSLLTTDSLLVLAKQGIFEYRNRSKKNVSSVDSLSRLIINNSSVSEAEMQRMLLEAVAVAESCDQYYSKLQDYQRTGDLVYQDSICYRIKMRDTTVYNRTTIFDTVWTEYIEIQPEVVVDDNNTKKKKKRKR